MRRVFSNSVFYAVGTSVQDILKRYHQDFSLPTDTYGWIHEESWTVHEPDEVITLLVDDRKQIQTAQEWVDRTPPSEWWIGAVIAEDEMDQIMIGLGNIGEGFTW